MKTKKIIVFGAGYPIILQLIKDINLAGTAKFEILGFVVDDQTEWGKEYFGYPILGKLETIKNYRDTYIINNVGSTTAARYSVDKRILRIKKEIPSLIHPTVDLQYSEVGMGCIISRDVFIGAGSKIGDSVCLRNNVFLGNEVNIGNNVFISDQTVVLGYVEIEDYTYLGANVTILPRLKLSYNSLLGAGAVVTKNIPANQIHVGNPAKYLKENKPLVI